MQLALASRQRGTTLSRPFQNILWLSAGDFVAKSATFFATVYLARVLGAESFGALEFASSLMTYFLFAADAGVEVWAVREIARGTRAAEVAPKVQAVRLCNAALIFVLMAVSTPLLPAFPHLKTLVALFGLGLFVQAANVKWYFMGRQRMRVVAASLIAAQILFAAAVLAVVREAEHVVWVPVARLASDASLAVFFGLRLRREARISPFAYHWRGAWGILKEALTLGASNALALVNYNFDTIVLGFLAGADAVGRYNAAYKLIIIALALPISYFLGVFPALSNFHGTNPAEFRNLVNRSLRMCSVYAVPVGMGSFLLAEPLVLTVFGPQYLPSVVAFQILIWSAVLVILRGTYRQGLNAANFHNQDLKCAVVSSSINVALNFALIPKYQIVGAAIATLVSEIVWFLSAALVFSKLVFPARLFHALWRPVCAGLLMAAVLYFAPLPMLGRALLGSVTYFGVLRLLGESYKYLLGGAANEAR